MELLLSVIALALRMVWPIPFILVCFLLLLIYKGGAKLVPFVDATKIEEVIIAAGLLFIIPIILIVFFKNLILTPIVNYYVLWGIDRSYRLLCK